MNSTTTLGLVAEVAVLLPSAVSGLPPATSGCTIRTGEPATAGAWTVREAFPTSAGSTRDPEAVRSMVEPARLEENVMIVVAAGCTVDSASRRLPGPVSVVAETCNDT
jgi:hypothetical protein